MRNLPPPRLFLGLGRAWLARAPLCIPYLFLIPYSCSFYTSPLFPPSAHTPPPSPFPPPPIHPHFSARSDDADDGHNAGQREHPLRGTHPRGEFPALSLIAPPPWFSSAQSCYHRGGRGLAPKHVEERREEEKKKARKSKKTGKSKSKSKCKKNGGQKDSRGTECARPVLPARVKAWKRQSVCVHAPPPKLFQSREQKKNKGKRCACSSSCALPFALPLALFLLRSSSCALPRGVI